MSLWQSFTNDKKSSTREVINKLIMRFPWVEKKRAHGIPYLTGLSESETLEPNEPTEDTSAREESVEDNLGCLRVLENDVSTLTIGKQQKAYVKVKSAPTSTLEHPNTSEGEVLAFRDSGNSETSDTSPRIRLGKKWPDPGDVFEETPTSGSSEDQAFSAPPPEKEAAGSKSELVFSLLVELYEVFRENLRMNNLSMENAHVSLDDLKEYAKLKGITGEVFRKAYLALLDSKRIIYEEPYVRLNYERN
jgi:hypothetical protein